MASNLVTLEENKELDGAKIAEGNAAAAAAAAAANNATGGGSPTGSPALVRLGSKDSVITTKSIKINDSIGEVKVHIQGELDDKKAVFLTVHDIGSNSNSMREFVDIECMTEIKLRSVFVHVDVPGQEDNAPDIENFPTILELGTEILVKILDEMGIPLCVGIGDGAGANILARFGLAHPDRVLGLVLVNLVSAGVGFLESIKEKLFSAKRRSSQQLGSEEIVAMHKVGGGSKSSGTVEQNKKTAPCTNTSTGSKIVGSDKECMAENSKTNPNVTITNETSPATPTTPTIPNSGNKTQFGAASDEAMKQLIENYSSSMSKINAKNLRKYLTAYMNRKEINELAGLDVLLVTGSKSPFASGVEHIYAKCNKSKTSLLKVDGAVDIFSQCPEKFAQSLLLFVKGLGFLTSLQLPGITSEMGMTAIKSNLAAIGRRRTLSMEEYDIPRMRRLSLTK